MNNIDAYFEPLPERAAAPREALIESASKGLESTSGAQAQMVLAALGRLRSGWSQGRRITTEEVLRECRIDVTNPENATIVERTALEEVYLRMQGGEFSPFADEFVGRFPVHAAGLRELLSCCEDQRSVLQLLGDYSALSTGADSFPAAQSADAPLISDYILLHKIGSGAFGVVWLARNRLDSSLCAVKVFEKHTKTELRGVRAYRSCAANHPHLIPIRHVGETEQVYYYVMDLADNALEASSPVERYEALSLQRLIQERGALPVLEVAQILGQVLSGLRELHKNGICHYDIKPANILRADGKWRLGDMGLAGEEAKADAARGTPAYWPPEGAKGTAADRYAIGLTAFVAATGRKPAALRELPTGVPMPTCDRRSKRLQSFILKACNASDSRRFATAEQMAKVVDSIGDSWQRRARVAAPYAAGTLVILVAFGILLAVLWSMHRESQEQELALLGERFRYQAEHVHWDKANNVATTRLDLLKKLHPDREAEIELSHNELAMARQLANLPADDVESERERERIQHQVSSVFNYEVNLLLGMDKFDEALQRQERDVEILDRILADVAPVIPEVSRLFLGSLYREKADSVPDPAEKQDFLKKAEQVFLQSAQVFDRRLGPSHANSMIAWHNLGNCLTARGEPQTLIDAEKILRRILALRLQTLKDHDNTVSSYLALARNLASRPDASREQLNEARRLLNDGESMLNRISESSESERGAYDRLRKRVETVRQLLRDAERRLQGE
ncbi:MAG: serine/threonine protein kinase [Planctomycetaceae bacterium]|nr:serine/threonine protein kinase [Planctomycetaceae bacterium]